ncbi:MAG TPA: hypothetical protein VHE57_04175 [Mycobacteriales bacterium]|nr:hypothetical protein [Mycobacteriales bacterium]
MTQLDLHGIVPEPPADLLDWAALDRRIRRRRLVRQAVAVGSATVIVAGVAIVAVSIGNPAPTPPAVPASGHSDGRIVFGQDTIGVTKTNPFADTSLYSATPQGTAIRRLTHAADGIYYAVASPDGRRIAYTQETYGVGSAGHPTHVNGAYVHVINANGSDDRRVYRCPDSSCESLVWSPDSQRLLINGNRLVQPDGRITPLCIGDCGPNASTTDDASWSPDGRRLAFQYYLDVPLHNGRSGPAGTSTVQAIGVMDSDGSNPKPITDVGCSAPRVERTCTADTNPVWSPDGESVAFTRRPLSYLLPNNSQGGPVILGPSRIETANPDGADAHQVFDCGQYCAIRSMTWSPAGRKLAFVTEDERGLRGKPPWSLHVLDLSSGRNDAVPLTFLTDNDSPDYTWAPSGDRIAIGSRAGDGSRAPGIYLVSVTNGRLGSPRLLTPTGLPPITWLARVRD